MAPILRRSARLLAAEDDDDDSSDGDEVEQQPTMKHLPLPRQGEQSSDDEELGIESSPDLVGMPAKTPPPPRDQDGREVSGSGGADKPPEPALQAKKPSDAAKRKDEGSDSDEDEVPLEPVPPSDDADEESGSDDADEESDSDDDSDEDQVPVEEPRMPMPSDDAEDEDEESESDEDEVPVEPRMPSDGAEDEDEESDSDEDEVPVEPRMPSDGAEEDEPDSDEDQVPVEPVPQTSTIPPSDGAEHKDEEADSGENGEPPLANDPNGKRKAPSPQVSESPPQKRMVLQANHEHNSGTTDTEKQFMDKCASYFYLGKEVSVLNEEYPGLFKKSFLELGDDQASALDARIKNVSLAEIRLSLRRRNLEQEVIKSVLKLLK
ncbi:nucleoplasmin-like protein ANO39 isoform X2 [Oryza brachyantha]|uniref:nucleoplasmin-like protein ANO39 isoform X2 n=1 Tax=Oryza brachyantha TaxID=4533 RepID=UPI001AD97B4C|nr:nucleoplasmin-like protein ANO39 isoform X2 [Oryza brachyantha]